jgi:hypothetical protein
MVASASFSATFTASRVCHPSHTVAPAMTAVTAAKAPVIQSSVGSTVEVPLAPVPALDVLEVTSGLAFFRGGCATVAEGIQRRLVPCSPRVVQQAEDLQADRKRQQPRNQTRAQQRSVFEISIRSATVPAFPRDGALPTKAACRTDRSNR